MIFIDYSSNNSENRQEITVPVCFPLTPGFLCCTLQAIIKLQENKPGMLLVGPKFYRPPWWRGAKFRRFSLGMSQPWKSFSLDMKSFVWTIIGEQCQCHISSAEQQLIPYRGIIAVAKTRSHQVRLERFLQVGNEKINFLHSPLFSMKQEAESLSGDTFLLN